MSLDGLVQALATLMSSLIAIFGALAAGIIGAGATLLIARGQLMRAVEAERISRIEARNDALLTSVTAFYSELRQVGMMVSSGENRVGGFWIPLATAGYLDARQHFVLLPDETQSLIRVYYTFVHQYNYLVGLQPGRMEVSQELNKNLESLTHSVHSVVVEVGESLRQHMSAQLGTEIDRGNGASEAHYREDQ